MWCALCVVVRRAGSWSQVRAVELVEQLVRDHEGGGRTWRRRFSVTADNLAKEQHAASSETTTAGTGLLFGVRATRTISGCAIAVLSFLSSCTRPPAGETLGFGKGKREFYKGIFASKY